MQILIVVIFALFGGLTLIAWYAASRASYNQAQAVIEVSQVANTLANDNSRLTTTNIILTFLLLLVILAAVVAVVLMYARTRRQLADARPNGQWRPGPNALYQRQDQQLPAGDTQTMLMLMMMQQLNQSQRMQQLPNPAEQQYQLPAPNQFNPFSKSVDSSVDSWWS